MGQGCKRQLIAKIGSSLQALPLWGPDFHDVTMHLEYADTDDIRPKRRHGRNVVKPLFRVIVFVHHPEYFFHVWSQAHGEAQDRKLTAAARMAKVQSNGHFFERHSTYRDLPLTPLSIDLLLLERAGSIFTRSEFPCRLQSFLKDIYHVNEDQDLETVYRSVFGNPAFIGGSAAMAHSLISQWRGPKPEGEDSQ